MSVKADTNVLSVDWGSKYVGMAYVREWSDIVMPIGYLVNDGSIFFNIGDILTRYQIKKIIVGYPRKQKDIQEKIDDFVKSLEFMLMDEMEVLKVNEDYTSVEAWEIISNFRKKESTDTIAAMVILERYLKNDE